MSFSPGEFEYLERISDRLNMDVGAWVGELSVRHAQGQLEPIPASWRDLMGELLRWRSELAETHMLLRSLVARADGQAGEDAERMLARVDGMLTRADEVAEEASRRVSRHR